MKKDLIITKKETGKPYDYRTFSIRLKTEKIAELENLCRLTNRSRNELINIFVEYGLENYEKTE